MSSQIPFRVLDGAGNRKEELRDEQELIAAAQHGYTAAFQQLYDHYRDRIYNVIYYSLDDLQQAEDVLQSVFVKVFRSLPTFRFESSLLTWMYRITLNECKNRKRGPRLFVPISKIREGLEEPDPGPGPEDLHAAGQRSRMVRHAVMNLKPKYRSVVILKYLEEMSYEKIAQTLHCSPGTVASRLSRALEILAARLSRL